MAGISQTDAQSILDALVAISLNFNGQQEVSTGTGKTIKFRTYDELIKAIDFWEKKVLELASHTPGSGIPLNGASI